MLIETSFDDGYLLDLKVAQLLAKHRIVATFYIPVQRTELSVSDIRLLSKYHEIGSHTMTHPQDLKLLSPEDLENELVTSKKVLEDMIGKEVTKFCYPRGRFNTEVKEAVRQAGYKQARTTRVLAYRQPTDPLEYDTSVHVFNRKEYEGFDILKVCNQMLLNANERNDGYFHLWAHSNELEKEKLWDVFEDSLALIRSYA